MTLIGLALTYLILLRASELFAEDDGIEADPIHAMYLRPDRV